MICVLLESFVDNDDDDDDAQVLAIEITTL